MEDQSNRTGLREAQGIGSDSSNANEHSESQPVYQTAQLLHVYTERVPEGQEHSREPIHNTEAGQSPGEATQRCCCLKDDGTVRAEGSYCSLCGKLIDEQSRADHLPSVRPAPLPPEYAREFALSLPSLPCESSADDHNPSEYNEDPSQAEGRGKIPVHGMWPKKTPIQIPSRPREFECYLTDAVHPPTNETGFSIHFVAVQRYPDETIKVQGDFDWNVVKFIALGEEGMSIEESKPTYRISLTKDTKVTIEFELLRRDGKFEIVEILCAQEVPLHKILSASQHRLPGPIARILVRCLGEPGELCQNHIRMKIKYGQNQRIIIFPIWFCARP
ncbi:uncharacterized protein [Montipora foliosa]|uniref:uncharacterized protein n=1 Tax=Montipora foliosa TaxID=591990 RepID=UPI0035F1BF7B